MERYGEKLGYFGRDRARFHEIWGDMGRYGEIWGRYGGDMGEIWGRYGETWGDIVEVRVTIAGKG